MRLVPGGEDKGPGAATPRPKPTGALACQRSNLGRHIATDSTFEIRQTTPPSTDLSYAQIFDDFRLGCGE